MLCGIDDNPATEEQGTRAFKINFISFEYQEPACRRRIFGRSDATMGVCP